MILRLLKSYTETIQTKVFFTKQIHFSSGYKHFDGQEYSHTFIKFVTKSTIVVQFYSDNSVGFIGWELSFKKLPYRGKIV